MTSPAELINALTPSEQFLLNAAVLVPKGGLLDKYRPLGTDVEVSKKQLAQQAYAVAFLGLEESDDIRLETRPKKALFGLRTVQAFYAEPVADSGQWPASSLEASLLALARQLQGKKAQNEVQSIVYALFTEDVLSPFDTAIAMAQQYLAQRGLLEVVKEKKLKIITTSHYVLPEATAVLAREGLDHARQLVETCRQQRPELWKQLTSEITGAIQRRTEQSDTGSSD